MCCLWIADHEGAVAALRRYIARTGPTLDAVELEALCQRIERSAPYDQVEFVHLSWPIRNRDGLLAALRATRAIDEGPKRPLDPNDPKSLEVERFFLLDRPRIEARTGLKRQEIPVILGEVLFSNDTVILETYDDGRLDRLVDRFTAAAGSNIPPAHPRTKIIGKEQRHLLALSWRWQLPEGLSDEEAERLNDEQIAHIIRDIWPETPNPALRWRTPLRAAKAGDSETALRAAVLPARGIAREHGSISSIGTSSAQNSSSRPSPPSIPIAWTSTSFPCRDCRGFPSTGSTMTESWLFTAGLASGEFARSRIGWLD